MSFVSCINVITFELTRRVSHDPVLVSVHSLAQVFENSADVISPEPHFTLGSRRATDGRKGRGRKARQEIEE